MMILPKLGKRKLYRMTKNRVIMLSDIITTINSRIEMKDEEGYSRLLILHNDRLTTEQKTSRLSKLDKDLEELYLFHDVVETVISHNNELNLSLFLKEKRDWKNEWDIPLDVFNHSIDGIMELLKWHQENGHPKYKKKYDEKISSLIHLKKFRNA